MAVQGEPSVEAALVALKCKYQEQLCPCMFIRVFCQRYRRVGHAKADGWGLEELMVDVVMQTILTLPSERFKLAINVTACLSSRICLVVYLA
ncbi:hypothetical protein PC119_g7533 [Phytophthora cactorum]|nr:hypothetical protein PC114_g9064 [Phytophthora cactorum]KAG3027038.1 hypothetical protein PC119_g7533 [Phytophthora cactorum]KAG3165986.1 hypothetical protein C6341_g12185 [Phytophthora cactorum]